ncbi:MAG: hypothetical protein ABIR17_01090 [Pseudolysinimonas sp.]|uniref:hypothetical protein n=1 Tax=Pseudolysinimonas sp. TaxID=2680009 RepID=UPI00326742C8
MTVLLVAISFAAGGFATLAIFQLVRRLIDGRMVWPAIAAAILTTAVTTLLGMLTGAARLDYLLGISAFTLPVLVLLESAAIASGANRVARWVLMLTWGLIVFPVAAVLPLVLTNPCRLSGCGFTDFGGALPLFVSASAYVLLAWSPGVGRTQPQIGGPAALVAALGFWVAFAVWLSSLEAAVDVYIPRILLAGAVGPLAGAVGWLLVDRLKAVGRAVPRSLGFGFFAGIAATISGAVTVSFPWSLLVGALAGVFGALIHSARVVSRAGVATRWGLTLLVAAAIGFLAPPIAGDTVGVLFSAQVGVLNTPLLAFLGVAVGSVIVSAPAWVLLRRHQSEPTLVVAVQPQPDPT